MHDHRLRRALLGLRTPASAFHEDDSHPAFPRLVGRQGRGQGKDHKETSETSVVVFSTSIDPAPLPPSRHSTSQSASHTPTVRSTLPVPTTRTTTSTSTMPPVASNFSLSNSLATTDVSAVSDAEVPPASTSASTAATRAPSVNAGAIAGAVIVFALAGLCLVAIFFVRRRQKKRREDQDGFDEDLFKRQSSIIGDRSRPPSMLEPPMANSQTEPTYEIADYLAYGGFYGPRAVTPPFDAGQVTSSTVPSFAPQGQPSMGALSAPPHDTDFNGSYSLDPSNQAAQYDEIPLSRETEHPRPSSPGSGSFYRNDDPFHGPNVHAVEPTQPEVHLNASEGSGSTRGYY